MAENKKKKGTQAQAVAVATLERAAKVVKENFDLPDLKAGGHNAELQISVEGTIVVGSPSDPQLVPKVDAKDLVGGLLAACGEWYDDFDADEAVQMAVSIIAGDNDVTDMVKRAMEIAKAEAEELGHMVTRPGRNGAVSGYPFVRIHGAVGKGETEIEVRSKGKS